MRNLLIAVAASLLVSSAFAQEVHRATPFEVLLQQYRDSRTSEMIHGGHEMGGMDMGGMDMTQSSASTAPALDPAAEVAAAATKTFNVTAHQFAFTISPSPFVVNQGDTVTLNITSSDVSHGFFLESYATNNNNGFVLQKGKTTTVTFVANTPGTFTYFCTVSSCGAGHANMSGTMTVTAVQQTPAPAITSFQPGSGPTTGGTNVIISGSGFLPGAGVLFGSTASASVTVTDANTISAASPAHSAGNVSITVTNTDGQSAVSAALFTYLTPPPQVSSFTPSSGPTTGGTTVTISGSGFSSGASVLFGSTAATAVSVNDANTISATSPAHAAGNVSITVTNPDARSATSSGQFTYVAPQPQLSISAVSPANGSPAGGTAVTISGSGFTSGSSVTFGGAAATGVQVLSPTSLTVLTPGHAAGKVDVVVTSGTATATAPGAFTFEPAAPRRRSARHGK